MHRPAILLSYIILALLALWPATPVATAQTMPPKYEMRGVWITTNWGLDWPSRPARNAREALRQQQELCNLLDEMQRCGINVVFFEARIRGEVFYTSAIEPWSRIASGTTGRSPGYDPLAFAIDQCHRRGMECHAWLVSIPLGTAKQVALWGNRSVANRRPHMCCKLKGNWYLDPGHPDTAPYLAAIVAEIVHHYDIDGIHLDYIRYPDEEGRFPDDATYRRYAPQGVSRHDWRVSNITRIVRTVSDTIRAINPHVMFSTAPLGKYTSVPGYKRAGWACTEGVAQDPIHWMLQGYNHFVTPMMYYAGNDFYPFLADWMRRAARHGYIVPGLGAYRLDRREGNWDLGEIDRQIAAARHYGAAGQAFFRARHITDYPMLASLLQHKYYTFPALVPPMPGTPAYPLPAVEGLQLREGLLCDTLSWHPVPGAARYAVYASMTPTVDVDNAAQLVAPWVNDTTILLPAMTYRAFAVTAIDSTRREGAAARVAHIPLPQLPGVKPSRQ